MAILTARMHGNPAGLEMAVIESIERAARSRVLESRPGTRSMEAHAGWRLVIHDAIQLIEFTPETSL